MNTQLIIKLFNKVKYSYNSISGNNKLIANLASLSLLQATNFILPLLVFPYLVRVLGVEKFGLVSFAQALSSYLMIITDYSYNLTATRDIAINRDDRQQLIRICSAVFTTKMVLCALCFLLLTTIIFLVPALRHQYSLYGLSFFLVLGQLLFPVWFFQGIEQMKYITYLNIAAKVLFTSSIFIFVRKPEDYIYVNAIQGLGAVFGGILSIYLIKTTFRIPIHMVPWKVVMQELKSGFGVFLSTFSVNMYIYSNIFILGITTNPVVVGYYSMAEKTINVIRQLLVVFSQAIYPHICKLAQSSHAAVTAFLKKFFLPFATLILIACLSLLVFSEFLVVFLAGTLLPPVNTLIKVLSVVPFIVLLNIPAYQTLLAYNLKKSYSLILVSGSVLNILLNYFLSSAFGAAGTAYAVVVTELFITIGLYVIIELWNPKFSLLFNSSKSL